MRPLIAAAVLALPGVSSAHHPGTPDPWAWNLDPWVIAPLAVSAALYALGCARLARRAGPGRGIGAVQKSAFVAGWTLLAIALLSPVDTLGSELFWVHMIQHELLMGAAAPLLAVSRPLEALAWGLPRGWPAALGRAFRGPTLRWLGSMARPGLAFALHALAIWLWHVPALFDLALVDEGIHTLQHASFFGTGLAFWHSLWRHLARRGGAAIASLFATMMHMGVLGALLTFSATPWYGFEGTAAFGLTPLEDQQLGGLVMWVPGGLPYLVAALAIIARYIGGSEPAEAPDGLHAPRLFPGEDRTRGPARS